MTTMDWITVTRPATVAAVSWEVMIVTDGDGGGSGVGNRDGGAADD